MTDTPTRTGIVHLTDRQPTVTGPEMLASLVPPPQFDGATFESYRDLFAYLLDVEEEGQDQTWVLGPSGRQSCTFLRCEA